MENKYYTPNLEDLYLGYEYEVRDSAGTWKSGKFPEIIEDHWELKEFEDTYMKAAHAIIRTKFLDKTDIESLGWELVDGEFVKNFTEEGYWSLTLDNNEPKIFIFYNHLTGIKSSSLEEICHFDGECFSINELKKIMKWIGIS